MTEVANPPQVILPERTVDIGAMANGLKLRSETIETRALLYQGLDNIERGHNLLIMGGSMDCEYLLTTDGRIGLDGKMLHWLLGRKKVALATLWERYPELRCYLESRTRNFVYQKRHEAALLQLNDTYLETKLEALEDELELVL